VFAGCHSGEVAATERLLHEALALVHQNVLCPGRVSLRREIVSYPYSNDFLYAFSFFLCFVATAFISRQRGYACVASRGG
jgi:hypothetical protein